MLKMSVVFVATILTFGTVFVIDVAAQLAHDPSGDPCALVQLANGIVVHQAVHPSTIAATVRVFKLAKPAVPVFVCETDDPKYIPASLLHKILDERGRAVFALLVIPRVVADEYSESALLGVVAHETAHAGIGTPPACDVGNGLRLPPLPERLACEEPVDALAASWVGVSAVIDMLHETGVLIGPRLGPELRSYMEQEIASRIQTLEKIRTPR